MHRSIIKQKEIKEVSNLHKFSIAAVRMPFLMPLITIMIKLPPNKAYDMIYNISQVFEWRRWSNIGYVRLFFEIIKNYNKFG